MLNGKVQLAVGIGILLLVAFLGVRIKMLGAQLEKAEAAVATLETANKANLATIATLKTERETLERTYADYARKTAEISKSLDAVRKTLAAKSRESDAVRDWMDTPLPADFADGLRQFAHGSPDKDSPPPAAR